MHAILIKNLRTSISAERMSEILMQTFEKLLPGQKILSCKVLPKVDKLYNMAKELRDYKRQYRYYRRMNKIARNEAEIKG